MNEILTSFDWTEITNIEFFPILKNFFDQATYSLIKHNGLVTFATNLNDAKYVVDTFIERTCKILNSHHLSF